MDKKEFLNKYLENKKDWKILFNDFSYQVEEAGNDFYNVMISEEYNTGICYCKIESFELDTIQIADFMIPEKYEDFETVMDIFLK